MKRKIHKMAEKLKYSDKEYKETDLVSYIIYVYGRLRIMNTFKCLLSKT